MNKKEKDLNKVTELKDSEYIRAVAADGGSVMIKKSDLMPLATTDSPGLMSSETYITNKITHFAPTTDFTIYKITNLITQKTNEPSKFGINIISLSSADCGT
ncbi:MAG: hypothetical protein LIP08_12995, partial [Bacteroides sp.]|nr:hypothetical protein [Bacteroides sp.]